jgi:hypothetical protein
MIKFTGQQPADRLSFQLSYPVGYLDEGLCDIFVDALRTLASAIGEARSRDIEELDQEQRAVREALLGFSILTFNEARAYLIVAGAGLDRHAGIHFRSIMEYEFRFKRLLKEPSRAKALFEAFAHEFRKMAKDLELSDQDAIERSIADAIGTAEIANNGSEKEALFGKKGHMKGAMQDVAEGWRRYLGTFSWPSQVSHGTVLALRDLARSLEGVGSDFLTIAGRDGYGNRLAHATIWNVLYFANTTARLFGFSIDEQVAPVAKGAIAANARLGLVSPEIQRRAMLAWQQSQPNRNNSGSGSS